MFKIKYCETERGQKPVEESLILWKRICKLRFFARLVCLRIMETCSANLILQLLAMEFMNFESLNQET